MNQLKCVSSLFSFPELDLNQRGNRKWKACKSPALQTGIHFALRVQDLLPSGAAAVRLLPTALYIQHVFDFLKSAHSILDQRKDYKHICHRLFPPYLCVCVHAIAELFFLESDCSGFDIHESL